jgi:hypothetical protein
MTLHKITEFYTEWFSVYPNITSPPSPYLKTASNKIMIQIKLIGMSMISYYAKVHLSKCNGSWAVSTKQTMNFNIQTAAMFVFVCFWQKWSYWKLFILWRSVSIQNFMVPRWLVHVLHPPQKFERPAFWSGWRFGIKKYGIDVILNGMTSQLNYIQTYHGVQTLFGWGGDRRTDWLVIS